MVLASPCHPTVVSVESELTVVLNISGQVVERGCIKKIVPFLTLFVFFIVGTAAASAAMSAVSDREMCSKRCRTLLMSW